MDLDCLTGEALCCVVLCPAHRLVKIIGNAYGWGETEKGVLLSVVISLNEVFAELESVKSGLRKR